jgi:hypothetical protein
MKWTSSLEEPFNKDHRMMRFVQSKDVAWNFLGENIIAFNLDGEKMFHNLNPAAAVIFQEMQLPKSQEELVNKLLEEFDVSTDVASQDVEMILNDMKTKQLIVEA